jgi:nitroimidazol reductase NimA-like FMN-containing flavoprotein (pyridoxamine 5'-phosphate oxidase superfamily)
MRRSDREVTDKGEILSMLGGMTEGHLALVDNGQPYGVTMNFAFEESGGRVTLYFHCARAGRKLDALRRSPSAYFFAESGAAFQEKTKPDGSPYMTMLYSSVAGSGSVEEVKEPAAKRRALGLIAARFSKTPIERVPESAVAATCVLRMALDTLTAKRH